MLKTIILLTDTVQQQQPLANLLREHNSELAFCSALAFCSSSSPASAARLPTSRRGQARQAVLE